MPCWRWIFIVFFGCSFAGAPASSISPDAATVDASDDAAPSDAVLAASCVPQADVEIISAWNMAPDVANVVTDDRRVESANPRNAPTSIAGPSNCGSAVTFPDPGSNEPNIYRINDNPAYDAVASIDLLIFPSIQTPLDAGLLSRDSFGQNDGELGIYFWESPLSDEVIVVRGQSAGNTWLRCGALPSRDQWIHIGVNLTPTLELSINGVVVDDFIGDVMRGLGGACGESVMASDLSDGSEFWVVGAANHTANGVEYNLTAPFSDGRIDAVRFSSATRDFSGVVVPQ